MSDKQIGVGISIPGRRKTRGTDLGAGLPPAMLSADNIRRQSFVQPRPGASLAVGCNDMHPSALLDATHGGGVRVKVNLWIRGPAAQARQAAVLGFAI